MAYLAELETFLTDHRDLFAVAGSPIAVWLLGKLVFVLLSLFSLRRVHQIISPDDPALDRVEDIQRARFPVRERDPEGLLAQKIAASNFDMLKRPRGDAAMIVLYYEVRREIVGYLTAEYFRNSRTIFFWYIALEDEEDGAPKRSSRLPLQQGEGKVAIDMVRKLLKVCHRIGGWDHVIAEVDSRDLREAVMRLRKFRQYAWRLRYSHFDNPMRWLWHRILVGWLRRPVPVQPPSVFKVEVPFKMPLHEAGFIREAEMHETPAWLIVAPWDNAAVPRIGNQLVMPRKQVVELLQTLHRSYSDADEPEYSRYIAQFYDQIASTVPEHAPLTSNGSGLGAARTAKRNTMVPRPKPA